LKLVGGAIGRDQVFEHLGLGKALDGVDGLTERAGKQGGGALAGSVIGVVDIHLFGGGSSTGGNVVGDWQPIRWTSLNGRLHTDLRILEANCMRLRVWR
jgi:hypothetical protein